MRLFAIFFSVSIILTGSSGSFINPYPRFESYNDGGNPGEALYLTKYIENGEIETVSLLIIRSDFSQFFILNR